jgi:hypothetical protein
MDGIELSTEAQQALAATKLGGLRKKLNAESWSSHMEVLMKSWGEKAAGLRFMHSSASGSWKGFSNKLTVAGILITTVVSTASLATASLDGEENKNAAMYTIGGIGVVATLVQSLKKFYNAEEKAAEHGAMAKQFGSFYRYMTLQLGMDRGDRVPADELSSWALKEYERLQQDAPPLGAGPIKAFKETFKNSSQGVPDVCEEQFIIYIHNQSPKKRKMEIKIPDKDVTIKTTQTIEVAEQSSLTEPLEIDVGPNTEIEAPLDGHNSSPVIEGNA